MFKALTSFWLFIVTCISVVQVALAYFNKLTYFGLVEIIIFCTQVLFSVRIYLYSIQINEHLLEFLFVSKKNLYIFASNLLLLFINVLHVPTEFLGV